MKGKGTFVAYWHRDGLDVYRLVDNKPVKYASGSLDKLEPFRVGLSKKILIVGRELLLHARKKYPPATEEKLLKAVALEIGDIFPISKPAFYCRTFQSFSTYTVVDIWAWDSEQYSRIKEVFPFNYVVPEDLAFDLADSHLKIFQYRGMTNLLAHAEGKFLASASYPVSGFHKEDVKRFLQSLGQFETEIKKINIYGILPFQIDKTIIHRQESAPSPMIINVGERDYPVCLDNVAGLDLKKFKVKRDYLLWKRKDLIFRVAVYCVLGYAFMLYLTLRNYDQGLNETQARLSSVNKEMSGMVDSSAGEDYSSLVQEVNEKLSASRSPLGAMAILARRLPQGSFINRMVLSENNVEISVSSKEPLAVLRTLGEAEEIKKVVFKGPPVRNRNTSLYEFNMAVEFSR